MGGGPLPRKLKDLAMEVTSPTPVGERDVGHFLALPPLLLGFDALSASSDLLDLAGVWVVGAVSLEGHLSMFSLSSGASKPLPFLFLPLRREEGVFCHCDLG